MTQIKLRRDTSAAFASSNPVLGNGEPAYETDTKKLKIGDGTTAYTQLPYFSAGGGSAPSNMVTTDTAQTITGLKTLKTNLVLNQETVESGIQCQYINDRGSVTLESFIQPSNLSLGGNFAAINIGLSDAKLKLFGSRITDKDNKILLTQGNVTAGDNITITNTTNGISIAAAASSSAPPTQNLAQLDLNYVGPAGTYFYSGWSASVPKHTPIAGINDSFFLEIISNNDSGANNRTLQRLTYNYESSHKGESYFRTGIKGYDSQWTDWVQITPATTPST